MGCQDNITGTIAAETPKGERKMCSPYMYNREINVLEV
jgi:hypothetical protein